MGTWLGQGRRPKSDPGLHLPEPCLGLSSSSGACENPYKLKMVQRDGLARLSNTALGPQPKAWCLIVCKAMLQYDSRLVETPTQLYSSTFKQN